MRCVNVSGSECVRVTVSDRIQEYESEGNRESCMSGTKGSKAFPGAEAQRVKGENRNGPNFQGRGELDSGLSLYSPV